jgi:Uma2 family endonuclease
MEMGAASRRATYDDLIAVPDHLVAEILDGELFTSPRPALRHSAATGSIYGDLLGLHGPPGGSDAAGGWWILIEPELHLGADVLVPDLAAWRVARMPSIPDEVAATLAPDWVCEVVSPSTGRLDRTRKMPLYAREGVGHLWLVDPIQRTLEVYRLEAGRWVVTAAHGGGEPVRAEPFGAVRLDPSRWWLTASDTPSVQDRA